MFAVYGGGMSAVEWTVGLLTDFAETIAGFQRMDFSMWLAMKYMVSSQSFTEIIWILKSQIAAQGAVPIHVPLANSPSLTPPWKSILSIPSPTKSLIHTISFVDFTAKSYSHHFVVLCSVEAVDGHILRRILLYTAVQC